jgi:DNA-3-methyladenine glycosylase I
MSYCSFIQSLKKDEQPAHRLYHDEQYGFPIRNDNELFARLVLEINQAGLSWTTILNKQSNFRKAYDGFDLKKVAAYKSKDIKRLLNDASIIRNRLKIEAAIYNAQKIIGLQNEFGSFEKWLDAQHPANRVEWTKLFKQNFRFTGGEIVNEFLMSTGYLPGAHDKNCPIYKKVLKTGVAWMR